MNVITDKARTAFYENGTIVLRMVSGEEYRFPVSDNPRFAKGTPVQLSNIELSPNAFCELTQIFAAADDA